MGGNAFKQLDLVRIKRDDIDATLRYVEQTLAYPGLDFSYLRDNLMGSAHKQADSGDLDIAVDENLFDLEDISDRNRVVLTDTYVHWKGLAGGQIQTAWPIAGDATKGLIQIDFIMGKIDWIKFTHYSPGEDVSPFKGVWISTLLGTLAKMHNEYELWSEDGETRLAKVDLNYNIELGLYRKWRLWDVKSKTLKPMHPDAWETGLGTLIDKGIAPPDTKIQRFSRMGRINDPETAVQMLFGPNVLPSDIGTFEEAWPLALTAYPDKENAITERLVEALARSGLKYSKNEDEVLEMLNSLS